MIGPVEFNSLVSIIFDLEGESFLFFNNTILKIDFIFFFKWKVFK